LRHSAGLTPASTFTPWHPGIGLPQALLVKYIVKISHLWWCVNSNQSTPKSSKQIVAFHIWKSLKI